MHPRDYFTPNPYFADRVLAIKPRPEEAKKTFIDGPFRPTSPAKLVIRNAYYSTFLENFKTSRVNGMTKFAIHTKPPWSKHVYLMIMHGQKIQRGTITALPHRLYALIQSR
jgi:hypothetical protein